MKLFPTQVKAPHLMTKQKEMNATLMNAKSGYYFFQRFRLFIIKKKHTHLLEIKRKSQSYNR